MNLHYCIASHAIIQPNGALVASFDQSVFSREAQEIVDTHERGVDAPDYEERIKELEKDVERIERRAEKSTAELAECEIALENSITAHQNTLDELEQVIDEIGAQAGDITVTTILDMLNKVLADNQIEEGVK